MFKVSLGSFDAFPIFGDLVSRKRLIVERNGRKFGPRGPYKVVLTVKCSRSVWGHSVHIRFLPTLYMLYLVRLIVERNGAKIGPHGLVFGVYIECLCLLSVVVQFRVIRCISDFR